MIVDLKIVSISLLKHVLTETVYLRHLKKNILMDYQEYENQVTQNHH